MAKRIFANSTWTPVAVADTATMTASGFCAIQGGSGTQRILISEVYMGGQAGASSPSFMTLARDSTVATATLTALTTGQSDGPIDPATAALAAPPVSFVNTSGTFPQRQAASATAGGRLNLSFNAFGGIVRWVAYPGEEFVMLGNTASFGEASLSAYTGGTPGLMGSHIVFEPL